MLLQSTGGSCQEYLHLELNQHAHHVPLHVHMELQGGERVMKGLLLRSCLSPLHLGEIAEIRLRTRSGVGVVLSDNRRRD